MSYPRNSNEPVPASPSFPQIEERVLAFWKTDDTFQASIDNREGCDEWVFYDGPPFANGLPHYGHLLTGYAKDVFPRFQTMRGKQVHRRFGWDTHGLPAELEAMRQLGITEKSQIEAMGIAAFNEKARESVLKYTSEWQTYVTRTARWVDFENDYKTLNIEFMESVLWAFKQLYDKKLAYEGFRVLPYCWHDETPLSNHELRMDDDVYKMRQDQSVTVTFPLVGSKAESLGLTGVQALAWTTTPWTLPTNAALAVNPAVEYVVVQAQDGQEYLLAEQEWSKRATFAEGVTVAKRTILGAELAGVRYDPLWDYYATEYGENAFQILAADYVTVEGGTGIVHQAPAYGEDDQTVCAAAGIPVVISLDEGGKFLSSVPDVAGLLWADANKPLTALLREAGRLNQVKSYEHSYPHCWRCRNPLIYKAVSSWFVRVPEFRDRMSELNQEITWVPENVKDGQFGKWVGNARDWSISRNRYWGSPIPVWKSDNPDYPRVDVYGSLDELEADFGVRPTDLHRPYIDDLTRANPDDPTGQSTMRRIEDVFDVWFDSGSMPFAQVHYPFENHDWFDSHSPADFIVEYIGQTRGWFYVMHVLSTALFDRPAFTTVISHGIVLGSDGQKMSKSLRNYPDVNEVFDRDGSDAMRWFLMSSSVLRGGNLVVTEEGIRGGVREFLLPLWSTYYFFTLYSNASAYEAKISTASTNVLDRYLLAKTAQLIDEVTADLEVLDSPLAAEKLRDFADVLTNWYVRRSRDRFWSGDSPEAFDTLYSVLETVARLAAPLIPLVSEEIWQGLTGGRSVHLEDWPSVDAFPRDDSLVAAMDLVREVASAGLSLRKARGLRVRLPLATMKVVVSDPSRLHQFADILRDELNLKAIDFAATTESQPSDFGVTQSLTLNSRALGPRVGKDVQRLIAAARDGDWSLDGVLIGTPSDPVVVVGGTLLEAGEYELRLEATGSSDAIGFLNNGGFIVLNTTLTPELEAEGLARDVIRVVQDTRKAAGLEVSDRIELSVFGASEADVASITAFIDTIAGETLATAHRVSLLAQSVDSTPDAQRATIEAGQYANSGLLVIDVRKAGPVNV